MRSVSAEVLKPLRLGEELLAMCKYCWNIKSVSNSVGQAAVSPSLLLLLTLLLQLLGVTCHDCEVLVMFKLKTARCNDRNFQSVPQDLGGDIKVLNFEGNGLTYLGMDYFAAYPALQEIYFSSNRIDLIAPDAFRGLRNLQILDLSRNRLTSFPREVFKHLRYVREVNFRGNPIKYLLENDLQHLPNLEIISFENNWLERIHPKAFSGLEKLEEINLVNNELTVLSSEMEGQLPSSLKFFRLYQNPWNCDCNLRWLRQWIATTKVNWDFGTTIPHTPACSTPEILRGINWKHLEPEKFACGSKILTNGSATIELELGQNVTVDCNIISGDPIPTVHWMKGQKNIPAKSSKYVVNTITEPEIRSSLTIWKVDVSDQGDYKCVAKNPVGESEVTFKLWFRAADMEEAESYDLILGIRKEVILGIAVALAVLILILVICCVYGFRKRDRRNHAYKVRDYKKPAKNKRDKKHKMKHMDLKGEKSHPNVTTELLGDKKQEQKDMALKEINEKQNGDFKMKIFSYHDPNRQDRSQLEHSLITVGEKETDPLCDKKLKAVSDDSREATPDLLRNDYPKSDSDKQSPSTRDDNSGDEGYRSLNGSGSSSKDDKERPSPKPTEPNSSSASSQSAKSEKAKTEKRVDFADGVTSIDDVLTSSVVSSLTSSPTRSKKDASFDSATLPSAMKQPTASKLESATLGRPVRHNSVDSSASRDSGLSDRYAPISGRQGGRNPYASHTLPRGGSSGGASRQSSTSSSPASAQRTPHNAVASKQNSVSSSGSTSPTRAQLQHLIRSYQSSPTRVGKVGAGGGSPQYSDSVHQNVPAPILITTKEIPQTYTTKDGRTLVIPPPPPPPQIATRTLGRRLPIPPPPAPPQAGGPQRVLSPQAPQKPPRMFSSLYDFQTAGSMSETDEVPEPMPKVGEKTEFGTCV